MIVDVIAPGSACSRERLYAGVETLRTWGFEPRVPDDLFGAPGISANTDELRLAVIAAALRAPDSRLLWSVRGGYGSLRLLSELAAGPAPAPGKLVLGFSDVSALQMLLHERFGMAALHAPVVAQLGAGEIDTTSLRGIQRAALALAGGGKFEFESNPLKPLNDAAQRSRNVRGTIKGTNLETVRSLVGTPWQPDGGGTIWCFEEVNERGYQVDRVLTQLALAGAFERTRAVIFGQFTRDAEANGRSTVPAVLAAFAHSMRFPVLAGLAIGHGPRNLALPLGVAGRVMFGDTATLCASLQAK